jgi:hypothetical protein
MYFWIFYSSAFFTWRRISKEYTYCTFIGDKTIQYISADVYGRVFTSAIIQYYRMQWPGTVLVFPLFPTLLWQFKKRAPPYPHALVISDIYCTVVTHYLTSPVGWEGRGIIFDKKFYCTYSIQYHCNLIWLAW